MAKGRRKRSSGKAFFANKEEMTPMVSPSPNEFLNREIQWLEFNWRVLQEARDPLTPLLERLRFLSIASTNLDEFFMKRVGGLKRQVEARVQAVSGDGSSPEEQLRLIRQKVHMMQMEQAAIFRDLLCPELSQHGIELLKWEALTEDEKTQARNYFKSHIFPVLTPLAVDPGHPFPFISNLSISLAITLSSADRDEKFFARLKIPRIFPQWIRLSKDGDSKNRFLSLLELISFNLGDLFPSMIVNSIMPFRITRNADVERDEEDAEDLLEMITEEIKQRRFADTIRLEHGPNPDPWMMDLLKEELELVDDDIFEVSERLDFSDMKTIYDIKTPGLSFEPWVPTVPEQFQEEAQIFSALKARDILVHHPYESFSGTIEKFIGIAVNDPKVLAIKMTLYRTGEDSSIAPMLIRAAEAGKQVVCLVEVKARFDEERNIYWAQKLENAGVHVVYGVVGLKTHCKTLMVVRQEAEGVVTYVHIGTGNYHKDTAKLYTDLGLFTCRKEITEEVVELFHFLTGRSLKKDYPHLLVAPINMKERFLAMIEREIQHVGAGRPAQIIAKFNSLEDVEICRALYRASQAGVEIILIVRGFCCLRPKVLGLSEKIRVISVIGRFLEHSRIFYFRNGGAEPTDGEFFMGSADWMYRNLHARLEVVVPLLDKGMKERVWEILQIHVHDGRQAWEMNADGSYTKLHSTDAILALGSQARLMAITLQRVVTERLKDH